MDYKRESPRTINLRAGKSEYALIFVKSVHGELTLVARYARKSEYALNTFSVHGELTLVARYIVIVLLLETHRPYKIIKPIKDLFKNRFNT